MSSIFSSIPWHNWRPKLLTCLAEYGREQLTADLLAGTTVGLVALPLAMAFGIASGVTPQAGIYTAIAGGFIVSLLGGSRIQIGGPTVGRKNWLFAGSFEGARRAALLYSLVQSCKLVDVPPFAYLKDVLLSVATHPQHVIDQLTPRRWATTFGPRASA